jgi:hypothetical protein
VADDDETAAGAAAAAEAEALDGEEADVSGLQQDAAAALGWMVSDDAQVLGQDAWQQPLK